MICEHCARWADRSAETGRHLAHAGCPGGTWCDCQHAQVRGTVDPRACPLDGAELRAVSSQLHGPTRYTHTDGTEHGDRMEDLRNLDELVPVEELTPEESTEADARWEADVRRVHA